MSKMPQTARKNRIAVNNIFPTQTGTCVINNTAPRDWAQSNMEWIHPDQAIELAKAAAAYHDAVGECSGALEVGGGTIPRFHLDKAGANPYEHIRNVRKAVGDAVPLMMLVRSNAGGSMGDLPVDVLKDYVRKSVEAGIDVVRNFHSHNDPRQFKNVYEATKEAGGHFQAAYSWAVSDSDPSIFNPKNVVNFFKSLEAEGVHSDSFALKDPSGVLNPMAAKLITRELKEAMKNGELPNKPFGIHTHNQANFASSSYVAAAEAGANFIDVGPAAGGNAAQPPADSVLQMLEYSNVTTSLTGKDAATHKAAFAALKDVDKRAHRIALNRQAADYVTNPNSSQAVQGIMDNVVNRAYHTSISIEKDGIAGGQSSLMDNELRKAGMLPRKQEVIDKIPGIRADAGDTCQVTPFADRCVREAIRITLGGNPNKNFYPDYAKELTGESGPVQGVINPVKQRQALLERTQAVLNSMKDLPDAAKQLATNGGLEKLLDSMQVLYTPTRDSERLKLVTARAEELADLYKNSATDNDYAAYLKTLNKKISHSNIKAENGEKILDVQGMYAKLEAEANALNASMAATKNQLSPVDYEAMQKGKVSDALVGHVTEGNEALANAGLSREQIVKLMNAASVTTVVGADLIAPGLANAQAMTEGFFVQGKLPTPVSSHRRAEDISITAMFGASNIEDMAKSPAGIYFLHRDDKIPYWKHPEQNGAAIKETGVKSASIRAKFIGELPNRAELEKEISRALDIGPRDPRNVTVMEYGPERYQIAFKTAKGTEFDHANPENTQRINAVLSEHGGSIEGMGNRGLWSERSNHRNSITDNHSKTWLVNR